MSMYVRIVLTLLFVALSIGVVGPFLFSAPSDFAVIGGVVYLLFVMPAVVYYPNRKLIKNLMEK